MDEGCLDDDCFGGGDLERFLLRGLVLNESVEEKSAVVKMDILMGAPVI